MTSRATIPLLLLCGSCSTPSAPAPAPAAPPAPEFVLRAEWEPVSDSEYKLHELGGPLEQLRHPAVASAQQTWPNESLEFALPPWGHPPDEPFPLAVSSFLPFLQQLHPGAAETVRHMVQMPGAYGFVLAEDGERLDLLFRVHAGFELAENQAWIAPAQFEGRLVVDGATGAVRHFSLALPPTRPNVDVNLTQGRSGFIADIGSIPRMGVKTPGAPPPIDVKRLAQGRAQLQRAFYAFAAIDWLPLRDGLLRAVAEERPLHVVVLFGALADESC